MASRENNQTSHFFNVGGCLFSIPLSRLSLFQDSLLFREALTVGQGSRLFIDRDGCTFRHVHYYMHTGKLASSCTTEVNILYEQAAGLHLTSLQQALENLQSGKHFLRARPEDLQVTERATLNYWKTRICNPRLSDPMTSPVSTVHDAIPPGLVGAPLVDSDEEVYYCFLPLDQVRLHPSLVTQDNLLWLCEDVVVIECGSRLFRFLGKPLCSLPCKSTVPILLPERFHDYETLICEAEMVGITEFTKALQDLQGATYKEDSLIQDWCPESKKQSSSLPLYVMTFNLLVKYPDSSLGQLYVDSNVDGSKVYITGSGVIFQHVENWLGTCRLPLTETASQQSRLCEYLEGQDELYLAIKEAVWEFFNRKASGRSLTTGPWSASVSKFTIYKVIKVYVGTHWYATYLKTLLKYPELLSNSRKVSWIAYGQSLYVKGDGLMFRHILNFLRCGQLMLPTEFSEWPLLHHEIEEFQIPALSDALKDCTEYSAVLFPCREWRKSRGSTRDTSAFSEESLLIYDEDEDEFVQITYDEDLQFCVGQPQWDSLDDSATSDIMELQSSSCSCTDICKPQNPEMASPPSDATGRKGEVPLGNEINTEGASKLLASPEKLEPLVQDTAWTKQQAGMSREPEGQPDNGPTADQATGWTEHLPEQDPGRQPSMPSGLSVSGQPNTSLSAQEGGISREPQQSQWEGKLHTSTMTGRGERSGRRPSAGGCVLRVRHPPVVGKGGASSCFIESIIYEATPPHTDTALVYVNMTYEDMLYARECHAFLAGLIVDSKRLKDPRNCSLKMAGLVYSLWTEQAEPEDFVGELMKLSCFEKQKHIQDRLLQWVKYTLRFAKQYSKCIELLGEDLCQIATLFPED
ncbi:BTB/POZ domain-containing protein KCTD19-like [Anguilla anguilla]|uniref:BTB/POZ domain-containing protein KCTD19-like n=1 Tax=Anguilla anguilla TaxID=7936 RepID=UPI0015B018D4|nr:BTB/POZ domain-containing protein KCTD19-like [Anguilla anguilla]